jgi:anti-sigma regulatory factor (Ser/Thr protein kinase)
MREHDIVIEVTSDPSLLCTVRAMIRGYLSEQGLDASQIDGAVLGVDEACTNVIRHAYHDRDDSSYHVTMRRTETQIEICVQDTGTAAPDDAFEKKEAAPEVDLATLEPGGLGVQLMQGAFDDVEYRPGTPNGNCVYLRLRREGDAE